MEKFGDSGGEVFGVEEAAGCEVFESEAADEEEAHVGLKIFDALDYGSAVGVAQDDVGDEDVDLAGVIFAVSGCRHFVDAFEDAEAAVFEDGTQGEQDTGIVIEQECGGGRGHAENIIGAENPGRGCERRVCVSKIKVPGMRPVMRAGRNPRANRSVQEGRTRGPARARAPALQGQRRF